MHYRGVLLLQRLPLCGPSPRRIPRTDAAIRLEAVNVSLGVSTRTFVAPAHAVARCPRFPLRVLLEWRPSEKLIGRFGNCGAGEMV